MKRTHQALAAALMSSALFAAPAFAQTTTIIEDDTVQTLPAPSTETTGSIQLAPERVTEVRQIFVEAAPEPVTVDFEVATGTVVPGTVTLQPLPPQIIEIVPEYEGYQYVAIEGGQYAIVDPTTTEIVYVLAN